MTVAHVVGGDDGAVGVERVGLDAEHDLADVALAAVADEAQQAGDRADTDDEHAGGAGVERPGVADATLAEAPPQHADDVVAGDAGRLVDDGQAVDGRRAAAGHRSGAVAAGRAGAIGPQDVLDALGGADHVVGAEHAAPASSWSAIWRLIDDWMRRRCSSSTSRIGSSPSSPSSESKYTMARLSSLSTSIGGDRHERQALVVDAHQLLGDHLAQGLVQPGTAGIPMPTGAATSTHRRRR